MKRSSKISVVVPVHNTAIYLDRLFASLLDQTEQDFEMVFVDDGSEDESLEKLREFEAANDRVTVLAQSNQGAAVARNRGIEASTGELLAFVDSDDFLDKEFLERMSAPFKDDAVGMTVCYIDDFIEVTGEYSEKRKAVFESLPAGAPFVPSSEEDLFNKIVGYSANKMFRRSIVEQHGLRFQSLPSHDDMAFVYTMMALSPKMAIVAEPLYHYRQRSDGSSVTDTTMAELYRCGFIALERLRSNLIQSGKWDEFSRAYVNYALHVCRWKLDIVPDDKKAEVRNELRDEWFQKLDILGYPRSWYLNDYEYDLMCTCLNFERDQELKSRIAVLQEQVQKLESSNGRLAEDSRRLAEDNKQLAAELERVRSSHSFKLGYGLTALPRAIKARVRR